jgi:hypothetical protein
MGIFIPWRVKNIPFLIVLFSLALSGCSSIPDPLSDRQGIVYVPPTPILPTALPPTPLPTESPVETAASAAPICKNSLRYLADITIPDGTVVEPGQILDKRWEIENNGTCNWDEQYSLQLIAGPALNANESFALYPARSASSMIIQIIFTAPDEPGSYRSAWQAFTPEGETFGDPIFIEILILEQSEGG